MASGKSNKNIIIAGDSEDELQTVRGLLPKDIGDCWSVNNISEAVRLFTEKRPNVLILSFLEINDAEAFYLTLYRQCPQIQEIKHQTLVLCKSAEAERAFNLCKGGSIDDYVVNRPLYDPFRLKLSIYQALEREDTRQQITGMEQRYAGVGSDLRSLDEHVGHALESGKEKHQEALRSFQKFISTVDVNLDQIEKNMGGSKQDDLDKIFEHGSLRDQFNQFRQNSLKPGLHDTEKLLKDFNGWLQTLDKGYRTQIETLKKVEFPPQLPEIMLVDDDNFFLEMLGDMLSEAGFRVVMAENGQTALDKLHQRRPDLMLLDFNMPGLNGIDALLQIKADPGLRTVPVIMLTGASDKGLVQKSIKIGAVDFIVKPGNRETILAKIRARLPKVS